MTSAEELDVILAVKCLGLFSRPARALGHNALQKGTKEAFVLTTPLFLSVHHPSVYLLFVFLTETDSVVRFSTMSAMCRGDLSG